MDWGTSNRQGYLATSLPWRHRLFWSAQSGLCAALTVAWFAKFDWTSVVVTFVIAIAVFYLMAWVADLASWRPVAGVTVAALCGVGAGALWWALTRVTQDIWLPMTHGVTFTLIGVYEFADVLRRLSNRHAKTEPPTNAGT